MAENEKKAPYSADMDIIKTIYRNNPAPSALFDDSFRFLGCNPAALEAFGFDTEEQLGEGIVQLIHESSPLYQPSGRKSTPLQDALMTAAKKERHEYPTQLNIRGVERRFYVTMKRVPLRDSFGIAVYLSERSVSEERFQLMANSAPLASAFYDINERMIADCNMETVRLLGFSSKEEFIEHQVETLPGDDARRLLRERIEKTLKTKREVFNFSFIAKNGEEIPVEIVAVRASWRGEDVISLFSRDLRSYIKTEDNLKMHAAMLLATNQIASILADAGPETFDAAVTESLRIIGEASGADRASIWEDFEKNGKLFCRRIYEWSGGAEPQQEQDFAPVLDYDDIAFWRELMNSGLPINGPVNTLHESGRIIFEQQGIKSALIIPILIHGALWGFIGFADCHTERVFSKVQEPVLHSGGILIVSSIERNKTTLSLIDASDKLKSQGKLLRAVNDIASILLEAEQNEFSLRIYHTLRSLGMCAEADTVSIWENAVSKDGKPGAEMQYIWEDSEPMLYDYKKPFIEYESYFPNWYEVREDINMPLRETGEKVRDNPFFGGSESFLVLPLYIGGEFWGLIVFTHSSGEHYFSDIEKTILRSGGMLIVSAILRNEITQSLVEAREEALQSARSKSDFLSRMSHEIRTPINAIIGMTSLARKSGDMEKVKRYLETVDSSSRQLLDLINDVLDMSKIEANKIEISSSEFDFEAMVRRVVNVVQVKIEEKKIDFRLDFSQMFTRMAVSDELRLSQVLINLMSNAVKFTDDYGVITMIIRETPIDNNTSLLHMEVADSGIGIAPEALPKVFQSFEQGDGSITRQFGGTGLGLAICRRIIDLMGGNITVESELGKGSRFIAELPIEWGAKMYKSAEMGSLRQDLRILVVDDAPDVLVYFEELLSNFSLRCDTALSGADAIKAVSEKKERNEPYDVVFIDWYMPGLNGGETMREIYKIMNDEVIVIMISAAAWSEIEEEAAKAGVRHFLPKPVMSQDLYSSLIKLTGSDDDRSASVPEAEDGVYHWDGGHILLVEDNEINREIVLGLLEDTGITIDIAENGLEGVNMFKAAPEKYDLIFMDVHMPVMDGLAATREIRSSGLPRAKTIPVFAITADAFKEDVQASISAGMNGHIAKPFDAFEIFDAINDVFGP